MKKSTKALIICLVVVAVIAGGTAYTFRPLNFAQAVGAAQADDIEKLVIRNGTTGERIDITNKSEIEEIYNKASSASFKAAASADDHVGWSWGVDVYTKGADGYISYVCGSGFNKYDGYKGGVGSFPEYNDKTSTMENVISECYQRHGGGLSAD